jgi:hypothetical protein
MKHSTEHANQAPGEHAARVEQTDADIRLQSRDDSGCACLGEI